MILVGQMSIRRCVYLIAASSQSKVSRKGAKETAKKYAEFFAPLHPLGLLRHTFFCVFHVDRRKVEPLDSAPHEVQLPSACS